MVKRLRRVLFGVATMVVASAAVGSGSAAAADHYYCPTINANSSCTSGIQHTYANNNVAYAGSNMQWCEALSVPGGPSGSEYSAICTARGAGPGTIYGTWRDWCGYGIPGGCGWAVNGSTSLYDVANNSSPNNPHTFNNHSYW